MGIQREGVDIMPSKDLLHRRTRGEEIWPECEDHRYLRHRPEAYRTTTILGPESVGRRSTDKHRHGRGDNTGIATEDIPLSCPYWYSLIAGIKYPDAEKEAAAMKRTSAMDGTKCSIRAKRNGWVIVLRKGYRIQLFHPFGPAP